MADRLNCDSVNTTPINIDWRDALGENCDGYTVYESVECQDCGESVVLHGWGEERHRDIEPTITLDEVPETNTEFRCPACGETVLAQNHDETGGFCCPNCACEAYLYEGAEFDNTCEGYLNSEGPMINYWYPVKLDDCDAAAEAIAHLPLCVVEFQDGQTGLALTGGGMDLSWEICEAFVVLGYLPPFHFVEDLPKFAGGYARANVVLPAAKRTIECVQRWAENAARKLSEHEVEVAA